MNPKGQSYVELAGLSSTVTLKGCIQGNKYSDLPPYLLPVPWLVSSLASNKKPEDVETCLCPCLSVSLGQRAEWRKGEMFIIGEVDIR
jgi:hypothetical protein